MEKMRIGLVTIFEIENGAGVAQYILRTAKALKELGHDVIVISGDGILPLRKMHSARLTLESRTNKPVRLPHVRILILKYRMWRLRKRVEKSGKFDILHTQDIFSTKAVFGLSEKWGTPVITSFLGYTISHTIADHKADEGDPYHTYLINLERESFSGARRVICMDRSRLDYLREQGLNNGVLLPAGTDTEIFKPFGDKENYLLFVGNLLPEKGIRESLLAFAEIVEEFPSMRFMVIGEGVMRPLLEELVRNLEISDRVEFLGYIPNERLPEYYAKARVYLLPTIPIKGIKDGPAYTAQEAMACGTPVVVSDVGGLSELVQNGENGLVVPPGDIQALVSALRLLLTDEELATSLGIKARETVISRYDYKKLAAELEKIYRSLFYEAQGRER